MKKLIFTTYLMILFIFSAYAVNPQNNNQRAMKRANIENCRLSKIERAKLNQEKRRIHRARRTALADGQITLREGARLRQTNQIHRRNIRLERRDCNRF